jgi:hypothetical protein
MDDILRETCGFFAMMLGTLMDPIALPCYIASGLFFKKLGGALAASIGFNVAFRVVMAAIKSNVEAGVETGPPNIEAVAASFVGAAFVTSIVYFFASKCRKEIQIEAANKKQKDEAKPDA